jgi:hypothetical protein
VLVDLGTGDIAISKDQRKRTTDGDDLEAKSASGLLVSLGAGEDDGESGELFGRGLRQRIISWPHNCAPPVHAGERNRSLSH